MANGGRRRRRIISGGRGERNGRHKKQSTPFRSVVVFLHVDVVVGRFLPSLLLSNWKRLGETWSAPS